MGSKVAETMPFVLLTFVEGGMALLEMGARWVGRDLRRCFVRSTLPMGPGVTVPTSIRTYLAYSLPTTK